MFCPYMSAQFPKLFCMMQVLPILTVVLLVNVKALQFAPRLKNVLSRVLPLLGSVKDAQRTIFAKGQDSWQLFFYDPQMS